MPRIPSASNTKPAGGTGGTLGGQKARSAGRRPGSLNINVGDEKYLWLLVILEVATLGYLRHHFRRHHGG